MGPDQNPIEAARTDLMTRLAAIEAGRLPPRDLAEQLDSIRRIAIANGLLPAASVAHALESAIGRGERGPLISGWLSVLNDAIGSERQDAQACAIFTAACSVRLSG